MGAELPRMGKSVARVITLETDGTGGYRPVTIYEKGTKRNKKQSASLKPVEKAIRQIHDANLRFEEEFVARHKKSNTERRNGWLRDLPVNVIKASDKGRRKIKIL